MPTPHEVVASINKAMGEGTVRMGSDPSLVVKYLSTGVLPVDVLLGGGFPRGRSTELFGPFSSLKSYVALRSAATTQASGGVVGWVDSEHAYDPVWAEQLGVDNDNLILQHPATGEDAIKVMDVLIRNGADLVVLDSVAACFPKQQAEKMPGEDGQVASLARMMSNGLRRLNAGNKTTAVVFINQTRVDVGITYGAMSRNTTPGGKALGFYASQRIQFVKGGKIKERVRTHDGEKWVDVDQITAMKVKMVLDKSKLNKPHKEMWMQFDLTTGEINETSFLIAQGLEHGLVEQSGGGYWTIPEYLEDKVRGRENFEAWLAGDEDANQWLREQLEEFY